MDATTPFVAGASKKPPVGGFARPHGYMGRYGYVAGGGVWGSGVRRRGGLFPARATRPPRRRPGFVPEMTKPGARGAVVERSARRRPHTAAAAGDGRRM